MGPALTVSHLSVWKISVRGLILFGIGGCPQGMSGGMLMGINRESFEVENIIDGDYYIKICLKK